MLLLTTALLTQAGCLGEYGWQLPDGDGDGYSALGGDCDDADPSVFPGQQEIWYDGVDQNCDGLDDFDADGDGHVAEAHGGDDCHDDIADAFPGSPAEEVFYDCVDQDCDGNDGDQDGDGYVALSFASGSGLSSYPDACPEWAQLNHDGSGAPLPSGDCWDDPSIDYTANYQGEGSPPTPSEVHPGSSRADNEVFYDNLDQNCDGESDFDADGDGYDQDEECDDTDPLTFPTPEVPEIWYDCQDQNCDGNDGDQDEDGYLALAWVDGDGLEHDYSAECPDWEAINPGLLQGDCFDDDTRRPEDFEAINGFPSPAAAEVWPGAEERWYDGVDQDCAGDGDFDADGDYWDTREYPNRDGDLGYDCEDADPQANPGAGERCSTDYDDDCDGQINEVGAIDGDPYYMDDDGDSYGDLNSTRRLQCGPDIATRYTSLDNRDCDDSDALIHPNGAESPADGVDQNCDGDELCYTDSDGDGFGDSNTQTRSGSLVCDAASLGYADDNDDCDDSDASVNPDGVEGVADGVDQDCDGDELCYTDGDGDGYGDSALRTRAGSVVCDDASNGYADDADDCDDTNAGANPGEAEIIADGVDQDCDGDEDCYLDNDEDGFGSSTVVASGNLNCDRPSAGFADDSDDCDDVNSARGRATFPGAAELDSSSACQKDQDGDGYGDASPSVNGVTPGTDCDDGVATINTDATEVCDSVDNDCDGLVDDDDSDLDPSDGSTFYADTDGDGFGDAASDLMACLQPSGYVLDDTDCDDGDGAIHPGASELCSTADDDDCDGDVNEDDASDAATWYVDLDGDSYGDATNATLACLQPNGYLSDDTDCDDSPDSTGEQTFPGAAESENATACMKDLDQDGYGDDNPSRSGVVAGLDCDDSQYFGVDVNPNAVEVCDAYDNDCDGLVNDDDPDITGQDTWYADGDGDGFGDPNTTLDACEQPTGYTDDATDCDDSLGAVNPNALELCSTGYDDDCDGTTNEDDASDATPWYDDDDSDGYGDTSAETYACSAPSGTVADDTDCDDADPDANPGELETDFCFDGVDNDCDGYLHNGCFDDGVNDDDELMFSELFYFTANDSFTWFEVYNETAGPMDLEDFFFELEEPDGTPVDSFTITGSLPLAADSHVVLCYNDSTSPIAPYCDYAWGGDAPDFVLDDLADLVIRMSTPNSVVVDGVHFENGSSGWPQVTNSNYDSIELCTNRLSAALNDSGSNWEDVQSSSGNIYGTYSIYSYYGTPGDSNSRSCN
ncbi:MAG: putative metal-binding motif-containing protein [Alphaproteobacteria bacterium]|nr:putative metal-binding motif-containing protein [Alphaproteobacteria bacterium]